MLMANIMLAAVAALVAVPADAGAVSTVSVVSSVSAVPAVSAPDALCIQPLGRVTAGHLDAIERELAVRFTRPTRRLARVELPKAAYTRARRRYRADRLLDFLRRLRPTDCHRILGVTAVDISTTKGRYPDWGVMGLGDMPGPAAVISSFRTRRHTRNAAHVRERMGKLAAHELGHTFGLEHCPSTGCLMRDAQGKVATTDDEHQFCARCRGRLGPEVVGGKGTGPAQGS